MHVTGIGWVEPTEFIQILPKNRDAWISPKKNTLQGYNPFYILPFLQEDVDPGDLMMEHRAIEKLI